MLVTGPLPGAGRFTGTASDGVAALGDPVGVPVAAVVEGAGVAGVDGVCAFTSAIPANKDTAVRLAAIRSLKTDMAMVPCSGFWDVNEAGKVVRDGSIQRSGMRAPCAKPWIVPSK